MKKAILGPMWAGKTHRILSEIKDKNYLVFDIVNTRNSARDLSSLIDHERYCENEDQFWQIYMNYDLIVIDEIHLYQVFKRTDLIIDIVRALNKKNIPFILAGLFFDGYSDNQPFSIWSSIFPYCDEIAFLDSRIPCKLCGAVKEVFYTMPEKKTLNSTEKIGDHYYNVCRTCWLEGDSDE